MWSIYEIIQMWTAVVDESEEWSSKLIFQFKQLEIKKKPEKNQGFNRDTGAMLYQLSYESTHWERGQIIEFLSPVRRQSQSIYELFHIYFMPFHFSQEIWTRWSFFTFSLIFCKWPVFILQKDGELKITKSFFYQSSFVMRLQMKLTDSSLASLIRLQFQTQCKNYYTNKYFCFSAVIFIRKLSVDL